MTKEQHDCRFCHGKLRKSLLGFQSGYISIEGNSLFYNGWNYYDDEPDEKKETINFCPICGRKLK